MPSPPDLLLKRDQHALRKVGPNIPQDQNTNARMLLALSVHPLTDSPRLARTSRPLNQDLRVVSIKQSISSSNRTVVMDNCRQVATTDLVRIRPSNTTGPADDVGNEN